MSRCGGDTLVPFDFGQARHHGGQECPPHAVPVQEPLRGTRQKDVGQLSHARYFRHVTPPPSPKSEHDFLRLLQWAGAGCLGITAGFVESLKSVNPTVQFELSVWTLLVSAAVAGASWYVAERVFFRALAEGRPPPVKLVVGLTVLLTVGTLAGFVLALRGVSAERRHDMAVGTLWAVMALSAVGFAFWKVVQFLERDAAKTNDELQDANSENQPPPR